MINGILNKLFFFRQNGVKPSNPSLDSNILGPVICIGDFYDGYDTSSLVSSNKSSDSINNVSCTIILLKNLV